MNENLAGVREKVKGNRPIEVGKIVRVKILYSNETELARVEKGFHLHRGDKVIVTTKYGNDLGRVLGMVEKYQSPDQVEELARIIRVATDEDLMRYEENKKKELKAFNICREKIREQNLDMKLIQAHYLIDEPKILFFFTAEARVDFRELVKVLVSVFKMRIELRQIGVRDEARVVGGVGVCGRPFCCSAVTDQLVPVSIKMAKEQNLTLNSMKISGPCGRLLCCLAYEYETYCELRKNFPVEGTIVYSGEEGFKINEINVLAGKMKITGDEGQTVEIMSKEVVFNENKNRWELTRRLEF